MSSVQIISGVNKKKWKVIYSNPRWEKKVDQLLKQKGIECYCPVVKRERQWADRKKMVEMPLFLSYLFVRVSLKEELTVRQTTGVVNFVYFLGKPAIIRDKEMHNMRHYLQQYSDIEAISVREINVGDRAKIQSGVFNEQVGKIVQIQGKNILMLLETLECALFTKVEMSNIDLILS